MKFVIDGVEYDADTIDPSGADLAAMPKQAGMGFQTWQRTISQIGRLAYDDDGNVVVLSEEEAKADPGRVDPSAFLDSGRHMDAFNVLVWLARRDAGERITFAESAAVPFSRIDVALDEDDDEPEVEAEDPTPPPASAPGSGGGAAVTTTSTTA